MPVGAEAGGILAKPLRRVDLGVHGEGNEADGEFAAELALAPGQEILQRAHARSEHRAGRLAAGEDEVGHPDLTAQVGERDRLPVLIDERKWLDLQEYREG